MGSLEQLHWPRCTPRLTIRPGRPADAARVWAWQQLPATSYWLRSCPRDAAHHAAGWNHNLTDTLVGLLDERIVAAGKVAIRDGRAQQDVRHLASGTEAELGWQLDPAHHGQGLGTEFATELVQIAFDCGVRRVIADCFVENTASWRIMERLGMRREAHHQQSFLHRDGTWHDEYVYAITH